jgi:hypothetical protein
VHKTGKTEFYLNEGDRVSFALKHGLPKTTFNYLDNVKTHTYDSPSCFVHLGHPK